MWVVTDAGALLEELRRVGAELAEARLRVNERLSEREATMITALGAGASIGELAQASGLTPARVGQILGHPFGRPGRPAATQTPCPR
jgi:hypothetical protein